MAKNASRSLKGRADDVIRFRHEGSVSLAQAEGAFLDELVLRLGSVGDSIGEIATKIKELPGGSLGHRLSGLESVSGELLLILAQVTRVVRGDDSDSA